MSVIEAFTFCFVAYFFFDFFQSVFGRYYPNSDRRRMFRYLQKLSDTLNRIEALLKRPAVGAASTIEFYTTLGGLKRKVTNMLLKVNQNLPLSVEFKDAQGNPAKVDGAPQWAVTAPDLADLEVAEDGLSAVLKPKGQLGSLVVQVTADADLGEGVKSILGELPVDLLSGEAVLVSIVAGAPVDK